MLPLPLLLRPPCFRPAAVGLSSGLTERGGLSRTPAQQCSSNAGKAQKLWSGSPHCHTTAPQAQKQGDASASSGHPPRATLPPLPSCRAGPCVAACCPVSAASSSSRVGASACTLCPCRPTHSSWQLPACTSSEVLSPQELLAIGLQGRCCSCCCCCLVGSVAVADCSACSPCCCSRCSCDRWCLPPLLLLLPDLTWPSLCVSRDARDAAHPCLGSGLANEPCIGWPPPCPRSTPPPVRAPAVAGNDADPPSLLRAGLLLLAGWPCCMPASSGLLDACRSLLGPMPVCCAAAPVAAAPTEFACSGDGSMPCGSAGKLALAHEACLCCL